MVSIEDIAETKYCLDMRGTHNWSNRVARLRQILKLAAPKKKSEPIFTFMPFYFCENGYWYETRWEKYPAIDVFDINL